MSIFVCWQIKLISGQNYPEEEETCMLRRKNITSTQIDGTVMLQHSLKTFYLLNEQVMLFFEQAPAMSKCMWETSGADDHSSRTFKHFNTHQLILYDGIIH
jgi:hypothetical protein